MSYCEELFSVRFDGDEMVPDACPIGRLLVTAEQPTRYQAWAQIQDHFGHPHRVSYAQVNVLPGRDPDTAAHRLAVRRQVRQVLRKRYSRLMRGKGGTRSLKIVFAPERPRKPAPARTGRAAS